MVNTKEQTILNYFREAGRDTLTNASKRIRIPVTTIYEVLKKHEGSIIQKHTALLNFRQLGYEGVITFVVKLPLKQKENFRLFMMTNPHVNSIMKINNGYHYLVECVFKTMHQAEVFIEMIENDFQIEEKHVFYQLEEVVKEKYLLN